MDTRAIFYPSLIICGLLILMAVVSVSFTYVGLRVVARRFSTCPNCNKRGAGRIVQSVPLDSKSYLESHRRRSLRVTINTTEDHWECQKCGHQWTRMARETSRVPVH